MNPVSACIADTHSNGDTRPDGVLHNGRILKPEVKAVALTGTRVFAIGTSAEMRGLPGSGGRRFDLAGHCVTPGFNDALTPVGRQHRAVGGRRSGQRFFSSLPRGGIFLATSRERAVRRESGGKKGDDDRILAAVPGRGH